MALYRLFDSESSKYGPDVASTMLFRFLTCAKADSLAAAILAKSSNRKATISSSYYYCITSVCLTARNPTVTIGRVLQAYERLGYCPQVDPLLDYLTGRETLSFFARLSGIPERRIPSSASRFIEALQITKVADKPVVTYR